MIIKLNSVLHLLTCQFNSTGPIIKLAQNKKKLTEINIKITQVILATGFEA
jgi:hypothetical protein